MTTFHRWALGALFLLVLPCSSEVAEATLSSSISDSVTVNGRTATSFYSRTARTLTTTSPLGRQGTTTFDLFGRVSEALSPGVAPVASAYDAQGRLSTVTQGGRQTLYTYNPQGLLWKICWKRCHPISGISEARREASGFSCMAGSQVHLLQWFGAKSGRHC